MKNSQIAALVLLVWLLLFCCGCQQALVNVPTTAAQPTQFSTFPSSAPATTPTHTEPSIPETVPPEPKRIICIDAGHQQSSITQTEPIGPGATERKAKLSSGTQGVSTRIPEYQLNLDVSLLLEQELIARGYEVVMIRRTNDCPLSNAERAQVANESGADLFVRIHANGSDNENVSGMLCCAPSLENPYLSEQVAQASIRLSKIITQTFCAATGANNQGLYYVDTMTGINWCKIPVTIVEMGYMSNNAEDEAMATPEYRRKMVTGIANGIDAFFGD